MKLADRKKAQDSWATGTGVDRERFQERPWAWHAEGSTSECRMEGPGPGVTFLSQSGGGGRAASLQRVKEDATFSQVGQ